MKYLSAASRASIHPLRSGIELVLLHRSRRRLLLPTFPAGSNNSLQIRPFTPTRSAMSGLSDHRSRDSPAAGTTESSHPNIASNSNRQQRQVAFTDESTPIDPPSSTTSSPTDTMTTGAMETVAYLGPRSSYSHQVSSIALTSFASLYGNWDE